MGESITDIATFNSKSRAYEIKSSLDSPDRLGNQLKDYFQVFNEVLLVVPEQKLMLYQKADKRAGIITVPEAGPLKLVRAPKINRTINHNVIMELLWSSEYKKMASVIAGRS